jgi:glycosyltransferase involved in cell wall biosynthesis
MVVPSLRGGGLERLVRDLALGMVEMGFEVRVFGVAGLGVYAKDLEEAGIGTVDCTPSGLRVRGVPHSLIRALGAFRPHVIHAHSGTWYSASVAKAWLRSPALVYTEHGRYPPEPQSRARIERLCERATDSLCAVSLETAQYMRSFLGLGYTPRVIPNGVDLDVFQPLAPESRQRIRAEWGFAADDVVAISVGRFVPVKNHAVIVRAAAPVVRINPSLKIVFLGQGPLEDEVKKIAVDEGVADNVRFLGFRSDVPTWLGASDLFVNASSTEGQPVSILEAMAVGLPVVATPVGGVPEVLGSPPCGALVPVDSVQDLGDALAHMSASPAVRADLGLRAMERAAAYSIGAFLSTHADLYRELA